LAKDWTWLVSEEQVDHELTGPSRYRTAKTLAKMFFEMKFRIEAIENTLEEFGLDLSTDE
jgi:hypothetical protein